MGVSGWAPMQTFLYLKVGKQFLYLKILCLIPKIFKTLFYLKSLSMKDLIPIRGKLLNSDLVFLMFLSMG